MAQIEASDVIVMGGGANYFLSYWLEKSGLFERLPELLKTRVYVGSSAGSMLMQNSLNTGREALRQYAEGNWDVDLSSLGPKGRSSSASLGLVDFLIRPHFDSEDASGDMLLQRVASHFQMPLYALDDDSAIKVDDGKVTIVSEGQWEIFAPEKDRV